MTLKELANSIELSILKPNVREEELRSVVERARKLPFAGICVPPFYTVVAKNLLKETRIHVITVIGFPLGYQKPQVKIREAEEALRDGTDEVDMVLNISALKSGRLDTIEEEITSIVALNPHLTVKVIIECCYLSREEKLLSLRLIEECGAHFVKTSTGFAPSGATIEDVRLLKENAGHLKVKAAGGIKGLDDALGFIEAGADRIGTSSGLEILRQFEERYGDKGI